MILTRFALYQDRTLGFLAVEDAYFYSIERPWLNNEPYVSCIPEGTYRMVRVDSPRFGKNTWEIADVPNRSAILFHVANWASDLQGCVGLGTGVINNHQGVSSSRNAMRQFHDLTESFINTEITIRQGAMIA